MCGAPAPEVFCYIPTKMSMTMNANLEAKVNDLVRAMLFSPEEERLEAIREIESRFCTGCGTEQTFAARHRGAMPCQCQNDE